MQTWQFWLLFSICWIGFGAQVIENLEKRIGALSPGKRLLGVIIWPFELYMDILRENH